MPFAAGSLMSAAALLRPKEQQQPQQQHTTTGSAALTVTARGPRASNQHEGVADVAAAVRLQRGSAAFADVAVDTAYGGRVAMRARLDAALPFGTAATAYAAAAPGQSAASRKKDAQHLASPPTLGAEGFQNARWPWGPTSQGSAATVGLELRNDDLGAACGVRAALPSASASASSARRNADELPVNAYATAAAGAWSAGVDMPTSGGGDAPSTVAVTFRAADDARRGDAHTAGPPAAFQAFLAWRDGSHGSHESLTVGVYQRGNVRRRCYNPLEDYRVVGIANEALWGACVSVPVGIVGGKSPDAKPEARVGVSWQLNKGALVKAGVDASGGMHACLVLRSWGYPKLTASIGHTGPLFGAGRWALHVSLGDFVPQRRRHLGDSSAAQYILPDADQSAAASTRRRRATSADVADEYVARGGQQNRVWQD